jgi:hypothetical protein
MFVAKNQTTSDLPMEWGVYSFPIYSYNWGGFKGGIKIGRYLGKLLEKVFSLMSLNFNLGRVFGELLEMLSGSYS